MTYDLSRHLSPDDVCNVKGVVHGSNDIGDSTPVELQPPGGKLTTTSAAL